MKRYLTVIKSYSVSSPASSLKLMINMVEPMTYTGDPAWTHYLSPSAFWRIESADGRRFDVSGQHYAGNNRLTVSPYVNGQVQDAYACAGTVTYLGSVEFTVDVASCLAGSSQVRVRASTVFITDKGEPVLGLGPSVFDSTENAEQSVDGFSPWIVPETN